MSLANIYGVRQRFQRSVRIDADLNGTNTLDGYVLNTTAWETLQRIALSVGSSRQRAFTWTGAYGSGKSSLALLLCSLLSEDRDARRKARSILGGERLKELKPLVAENHTGWVIARAVATTENPEEVIKESIRRAATERWNSRIADKLTHGDLLSSISAVAAKVGQTPGSGFLLIVDELGRVLEFVAKGSGRLHMLQDLAELFCRLEIRCLFIGILHQAFQEYAHDLGQQSGDEWAKVQGRFSDIPFSADLLEALDLIGQAISGARPGKEIEEKIARLADAVSLALGHQPATITRKLIDCWPLHPLGALLLGPISKRRFGQNERTIFSTLCSGEPRGFQAFLRDNDRVGLGYEPSELWEYLQLNLEPAILASSDGHRWAEAAEGVERCKRQGSPLHVRLAKTIALIDLFGRAYQLRASTQVLQACFWDVPRDAVVTALSDLKHWSIAIFREHLDSWAIFAGSDVDLSALLAAAAGRLDGSAVTARALSGVEAPVVAKRHYVRTGTLRWFASLVVQSATIDNDLAKLDLPAACDGAFVLVLPESGCSLEALSDRCKALSKGSMRAARPLVLGLPPDVGKLRRLATEIAAYEDIRRENPTLDGDAIARRELAGRDAVARERFETAATETFADAIWFLDGKTYDLSGGISITQLASILADRAFPATPILRNELVNREKPSSNAAAARRSLMHRMVRDAHLLDLGIAGNPPEKAIYLSVLRGPGLHRPGKGRDNWGFIAPNDEAIGASCRLLWKTFEEFLESTEVGSRPLSHLYGICAEKPFGLRSGIIPILVLAFLLSHEDRIALYLDGVFVAVLDDFLVDRLLQEPSSISVRKFELIGVTRSALANLAGILDDIPQQRLDRLSPLAVAKPLVSFARSLSPWVKRTRRLNPATIAVRDAILRADDPYALLFESLPQACGLESIESNRRNTKDVRLLIDKLSAAIGELRNAYDSMLAGLRRTLAAAFSLDDLTPEELSNIARRAREVIGRSGDFRLDAFAQRLADAPSDLEWVQSIASLAMNKPSRDWTDPDLDRAGLEIVDLGTRFHRVERLIAQREGSDVAFSFLFREGSETIEFEHCLPERANLSASIDRTANEVLKVLKREGLARELAIIAVARALQELVRAAKRTGRGSIPSPETTVSFQPDAEEGT